MIFYLIMISLLYIHLFISFFYYTKCLVQTSQSVSESVCVCVRERESLLLPYWGDPGYCVKILLSSFPTGCLYVSDELLIINQKKTLLYM